MRRNLITLVITAVAATALAMLPVPASAVPVTHACPGQAPAGMTDGRTSLAAWARSQDSTISEVEVVTYACRPGFALSFARYLDKGNASLPMPRGINLWTFGPIGQACVRFGPRGPWICVD